MSRKEAGTILLEMLILAVMLFLMWYFQGV